MTTYRRLISILGFFLASLAGIQAQTDSGRSRFSYLDYLIVPLRVHLLSSQKTPDWHTTLNEADIERIVGKINAIWSQAGIRFRLESLVREEAAPAEIHEEFKATKNLSLLLQLRPESTRDDQLFHVYYLKQLPVNGVYLGQAMFVKDQASLRVVEGGIDEPLPRVSAHEIGHSLGLGHRQNETNLMASGTTGIALNAEEIAKARHTAHLRSWIQTAAQVKQRADDLHSQGQDAAAKDLYQCLAGLPMDEFGQTAPDLPVPTDPATP